MLSGCTKDEVLDQYNNIVQSAGSIALTGNSSLQGTKEKGIDDYTGSYTANYEDFSDTEYLFGGTSIFGFFHLFRSANNSSRSL